MLLKLWLKIHSNLIILRNCRCRRLICRKDGRCTLRSGVGDQGRLLIRQLLLLLIRLDSGGHLDAVGLFAGGDGELLWIDRRGVVSLMLLKCRVAILRLQLGELWKVLLMLELLLVLLLLQQQMMIQIVLVQADWLWRDANLIALS